MISNEALLFCRFSILAEFCVGMKKLQVWMDYCGVVAVNGFRVDVRVDVSYVCRMHSLRGSLFNTLCTPQGDKVDMSTHTYSHKPLKKIKVVICGCQADSPHYVWPDVWSGDLQAQERECLWPWMSFWDQVSLNNKKPLKLKPFQCCQVL